MPGRRCHWVTLCRGGRGCHGRPCHWVSLCPPLLHRGWCWQPLEPTGAPSRRRLRLILWALGKITAVLFLRWLLLSCGLDETVLYLEGLRQKPGFSPRSDMSLKGNEVLLRTAWGVTVQETYTFLSGWSHYLSAKRSQDHGEGNSLNLQWNWSLFFSETRSNFSL